MRSQKIIIIYIAIISIVLTNNTVNGSVNAFSSATDSPEQIQPKFDFGEFIHSAVRPNKEHESAHRPKISAEILQKGMEETQHDEHGTLIEPKIIAEDLHNLVEEEQEDMIISENDNNDNKNNNKKGMEETQHDEHGTLIEPKIIAEDLHNLVEEEQEDMIVSENDNNDNKNNNKKGMEETQHDEHGTLIEPKIIAEDLQNYHANHDMKHPNKKKNVTKNQNNLRRNLAEGSNMHKQSKEVDVDKLKDHQRNKIMGNQVDTTGDFLKLP